MGNALTRSVTKIASGKVREVYDIDDDHLLILSTDRISAFDVIMNEPVPDRGRVLTALTAYWLDDVASDLPHHLVTSTPDESLLDAVRGDVSDPEGRAMVVRKAEMLPIEFIVRGYLAGSGWKEYGERHTLHGSALPDGLQLGSELPAPVLTPSTKGELGQHDINLTMAQASDVITSDVLSQCESLALELYKRGATRAHECGFILADTKFEFGFIDGTLSVCDEVMTPDSSRFWPMTGWQLGTTPPAFDKQVLRDWLEEQPWGKTAPPPQVPGEILNEVRTRYVEIYEKLSGRSFADWPGVGRPGVS